MSFYFSTLVNSKLYTLFSTYLFISLLYMFQATQCSSSGESNCIVLYAGHMTGIPGSHLHRVIYTRWRINTIRFSWWWALFCL